MRTWAKELDSAGVPILEGSSRTATTSEGLGTKGSRGVGAFYHGESDDDREALADLEGGSSGAAGKAIEGRVPLLVVGSKDDVGEGVRRAGAELASELGAGHVTVVSIASARFLWPEDFFKLTDIAVCLPVGPPLGLSSCVEVDMPRIRRVRRVAECLAVTQAFAHRRRTLKRTVWALL